MIQYVECYEELSKMCASAMIQLIQEKPDASIVLATGHSPLLAYRLFVEQVKERQLDVSQVRFIKLDEWLGVSEEDPSTCEFFLQKELIKPLHIQKEQYLTFGTEESSLDAQCQRVNKKLKEIGTLDLVILGIGMNGHLGLNEPGLEWIPETHRVRLDQKTKTHAMLKQTSHNVTEGITLGIGNLLNSRKIILLISGDKKEDAIGSYLKGTVSTWLPASALHLHPNVITIIEKGISN